ncbi:MAG: cation:proton antiporter [Candidatus Scalindua sp.]|nr:cation:proton antiporter [Candidatus Scalindua sp.]
MVNFVFSNIFTEIAVLLLVAAVTGFICLRLRQPLIVAFIAVGILVGPSVLGWVSADDKVDLLAQMGIAVLLFVVGLKLDLHIIRTMGLVALASGLGQVLFTSVVGYFIAIVLGMSPLTSLYVAVALTFSSTIIIVKLLSDKHEVDTLHGRIAIGFLIVQDIVVVLVMIGLTVLSQVGDKASLSWQAIELLLKGCLFIAAIGLLMRYVLTPLLHQLARSSELLLLFAIAWAVSMGAACEYLGFSKEVGAFIAGVSLASTPYREAIGARLVTLRDFLLLFFFIDLGAGLELSTLGAHVVPAIILSLFVLIGNPLIVMVILGAMGYRRRTSFLAGLTVAQISEFSLILGSLGLNLGHIDADTMGLITLVGLITISASTYMILYSHPLYERISSWLVVFERRRAHREEAQKLSTEENGVDVILFGLGRFGSGVARELRKRGHRLIGVDFDPDLVRRHVRQGYTVRYGDAEDPEFLATLPLGEVRWVVSSVREMPVNLALLNSLRDHDYKGCVAVTAYTTSNIEQLEYAGFDRVLIPYADAAEKAVDNLFGVTVK